MVNKVSVSRRTRKVFSLTTSVVTLDGFGLDDDGGVAVLPCLRARRDGSGDVAGTQSQARRQCREGGDEDGDHQFQDFFLSHKTLKG